MVEKPRHEAFAPPRRGFEMRDLSRVATWGLATLGALTIAAYAASSEVGEDRLIVAVANFRGVPPPERLAHAPTDRLTYQLATTVRELSADREQLLARLDTLERNVSDVTGSISRAANRPDEPAPAPTTLPPVVSAPDVVATAPPVTAPDNPTLRATPPVQSDEPATAKPEFGVDLGRANSVEGLRQLWNTVKSRHGGALEGLRPIVTVREIARSGGVELRLVAGPLSNAAAAARICALLPGSACHPTVFDGQRLALR
jgi:hypothetical protein